MDCPKCGSDMQKRSGKHGEFMFCPMQYRCCQSTFSVDKPAVNTEVSMNSLEAEFVLFRSQASPMARMVYENDREFERSYYHGSIDPADVVFGGEPFVNGPYEDDEDAILW